MWQKYFFGFVSCMFILAGRSIAQNLVPNPSFETSSACPSGTIQGMQTTYCPPWRAVVGNTPDYLHPCSTSPLTSAPSNDFGYQQAYSGVAYTGMSSSNDISREYIEAPLLSALTAGHTYFVSMYVSLGDLSTIAVDRMGFYFSGGALPQVASAPNLQPRIPQVVSPAHIYLADTQRWMPVHGVFTASGTESWIAIGNFSGIASNRQILDPTRFRNAYYYVDEVCVFDLDAGVPTSIRNKDTSVCVFPLQLSAGSDTNMAYVWSTGSVSREVTITTPGKYWVKSVSDCSFSIDTINIRFVAPSRRISRVDTFICEEQKELVYELPQTVVDVIWENADTVRRRVITDTGKYWRRYRIDCTLFSDTIRVGLGDVRIFGSLRDTLLCRGDSFVSLLPQDAYNIQWSDGNQSAARVITDSGILSVAYSVPGCIVHRDTIHVGFADEPFSLGDDTAVCNTRAVLTAPGGYRDYTWSDGSKGTKLTVTESGVYTLTAINQYGCGYTDKRKVDVIHTRQYYNDTVICNNQPVFIILQAEVSPEAVVVWSDGSTGRSFEITAPGVYTVQVTDRICRTEDAVKVELTFCECSYFVPNAFSPNGDGRNDYFGAFIVSGCPVQNYQFRVFDRWGRNIYVSDNAAQAWDGNIDGAPAEIGSYFYTLSFEGGTTRKPVSYSGEVTLLR